MDIIEFCHKAASLKLVQASSGNVSQRLPFDSSSFYITGSGTWLEDITSEQIVECSLSTGPKEKFPLPSTELPIHQGVLSNRPDVNVVFHYQSVYGTILSCRKRIKNFNVIPEIPYYIGEIAYVNYFMPGSIRLANNVIKALTTHNLVIMRNHGLIVAGSSFSEVLKRALFFELACEMIVKSSEELSRITIKKEIKQVT